MVEAKRRSDGSLTRILTASGGRLRLPLVLAGGGHPGGSRNLPGAPDPAKTSADDVVLRPAPGAAVVVGGYLEVGAPHLEVRGFTFASGWKAEAGAADLTFRDVKTRLFSIGSARDVSVLGGEVGP